MTGRKADSPIDPFFSPENRGSRIFCGICFALAFIGFIVGMLL